MDFHGNNVHHIGYGHPRLKRANAAWVGALALTRLGAMMERCPSIGDVRGRGCLVGIELVRDRATRAPDADLAEAVLYRALDAGLSFKTTMGNVLTLTPPLTVTADQMADALDIVEAAIEAAARRRRP